jgi:phosphate starvation-inducible membrane PsiE
MSILFFFNCAREVNLKVFKIKVFKKWVHGLKCLIFFQDKSTKMYNIFRGRFLFNFYLFFICLTDIYWCKKIHFSVKCILHPATCIFVCLLSRVPQGRATVLFFNTTALPDCIVSTECYMYIIFSAGHVLPAGFGPEPTEGSHKDLHYIDTLLHSRLLK